MRLSVAIMIAAIGAMLVSSVPQASSADTFGIYGAQMDHIAARGPGVLHGQIEALPSDAGLLVVGPAIPFLASEADAIRAMLEGGGRVLIADRGGTARGLLDALDVGVSLRAASIYTTEVAGSPDRPLVFSTGVLPGLPEALVVPAPAVVFGGTPLLATDAFSWLDEDGDGRPGVSEPRGRFAVAAVQDVGDGQLIVVGSATLVGQRSDAADVFLDWVGQERVLLVDEGHRAIQDPLDLVGAFQHGRGYLWVLVPLLLVAATMRSLHVRFVRRTPKRRRIPPPQDDEAATIMKELA